MQIKPKNIINNRSNKQTERLFGMTPPEVNERVKGLDENTLFTKVRSVAATPDNFDIETIDELIKDVSVFLATEQIVFEESDRDMLLQVRYLKIAVQVLRNNEVDYVEEIHEIVKGLIERDIQPINKDFLAECLRNAKNKLNIGETSVNNAVKILLGKLPLPQDENRETVVLAIVEIIMRSEKLKLQLKQKINDALNASGLGAIKVTTEMARLNIRMETEESFYAHIKRLLKWS